MRNRHGLRRIVSASFLFLASTASAVYAQSVSVPFPEGFIGTVGSSKNKADNILNFSTLAIDRATFTQPSTTGQFTAQGNDIPGTLRLVFDNGTVIDVPGAINWRITSGSTLHYFGFIPDPSNPPRTITYGSSGQFTMTLNSTSNYGLRILGSSQTYADGSSINGNAATTGLLDALNAYLAMVTANGPKITGPSGAAGATTSAKTVNENQTAVATLTADRTVTWSIVGSTDAGKFSINPTTGTITFTAAPDFEAPTDSDTNNTYALTVLATDANGYTGQQTVTVTVANVDDTAPKITGPSGSTGAASSAKSVPENQTAVATFTADEAVTWSITGGADAAKFAIDPSTGAVTFLAAPDFEVPTDSGTNNVYDLVITAKDAANNTSSQSLAVTVTNLDEVPPQITGPSGAAGAASSVRSVNENQTAVATLTANESVTWSLVGGADQTKFAINPTTGALTFLAAPDYETPTDNGANNVYDVVVRATDTAGNASQQSVAVTILDLDEVAPAITGPSGGAGAASSAKSVPENQTAVATFTASETVTWSITGGVDAAKFAINPSTGALTFVAAPDFETPTDNGANNVHDVVITAKDAANNTSSQSVAVTVTNLDEVAPSITGPSGGAGAASSAKSVNENQTAAATLTADEPVIWSLVGGADQAKFTIDPTTGVLTFLAAPDYETPTDAGVNNVYDVVVKATDAAGNASQQSIAVTVLDLDEVAPTITGPSGSAGAASSAKSVNETQTAVATFAASETVTWSITGGADAAKFAIDPATGALTFLAAPDFETPTDAGTNNVYDVVITAKDAANNTSSQSVAVTVLNLDEVAPIITGPSGSAGAASSAKTVDENQTAVATLTASEGVAWAVSGTDAARFSIDPSTGALTFVDAPDYETPTDSGTNNVYDLVVTATDAAGNVSQQTVTVTVANLDEAAPTITGPSGGAGASSSAKSVNEGATAVHSFSADEGVTWALVGGVDQAKLAIDPTSGALTFVAAPDYEAPADANSDNAYLVVIEAKDDSGNTSQQTVTVTVTDVLEDTTAPAISGPSGSAGAGTSTKTVNEGQTTVTTFTANEGVTWSITSGNDQGRFAIDPTTGELTFVAAPDYEVPTDADTNNTYVVVVTATDGFGNESQQTLTVTVADLDDTAPQITGPSGGTGAGTSTLSVNEGTTAVYTFSAGETVTWALVGGNDQGRFAIDPSTGTLTFVAAPDYEAPTDSNTDNSYVLIVKATDANGNTSQQTLTITVLDLDDTAPQITGPSGGTGAVASTTSVNEGTTAVVSFAASEGVTWSITGGADQAKFDIDPNTGAVTFLKAPDFDQPGDANADNDYVVVVKATDANGNTSQQTLTITVLDLDDTAPQISGPSGSAGAASTAKTVSEGTTTVATFTAGEPVTWALVGGPDQARFALDPNTGALTFVAAPDFEAPTDSGTDNIYVLIVEATDADGNTSQQTVTITVSDVNENAAPPQITGPSGAAGAQASAKSVKEGNAAVATFAANEAVTWAVVGGTDAGDFTIDPATGVLRFTAAPDFEAPTDADGNNAYVLVIEATDADGNTSQQTVTVTVANVNEDAAPPQITGPSSGPGSATSAKTVNEGQAAVATFSANEGVTWSIAGGPDAGDFKIDPVTGALTFVASPDFEAPTDADGNDVYVLVIAATDANGNTSQQTITVTVANLPEDTTPPEVAGPSGQGQEQTQTIPEGETTVATFTADEEVTWSVEGGSDGEVFVIDPVTGELTFVTPPDYDAPTDEDGDNVYLVTVVATDADGNRTTLTIAVTVTDTRAPMIMGPSGRPGAANSATTVDEDTTAVATFSADEEVTWSVSGGADARHFVIDPATGEFTFVAPTDYEAPKDHGRDNRYVVVVTATDASGNVSRQTLTVQVADVTDTPSELFDERRDEVEAIVQDVEENHLRAVVASQQAMTHSARDRFIESERLREICHDLDDPNRPVTSVLRDEEECSLLATRNDVPLDVDGTLEVSENGIVGAGSFFGQAGNFEGTRRRVIEGEFQLVDDGEGIKTFDFSGRVAWERLVSENVMLGTFVGGSVARSDVERELSGSVDKQSLSFGTYVVTEPVENLYFEGFLAAGLGRNELALSDDRLELEGDYMTRSLLVGGALSGVIEREHFEIRPEFSVAYGTTSFGDLELDATAFGMTEEVIASIDGVDYATIRLTPEILVPLQRLSDDATLVVAPSLACEWTGGDQECGGGLRLGLRGTSRDGLTSWDVSLTADRIGDTSRTGIEASIEHKF